MTAQVIAIDSDEHRAVQAVLPWFTNGTLAAGEAERVRQHVAQCPRCQADAATQDAIRRVAAKLPASTLDVERGWAAMRARLAPARGANEGMQPSWWSRFGWPVLVGAQAIAVAVLAMVIVARPAPQGAEYQGLGAAPPVAAANALIVFAPGATEAQMRHALRAGGARIVDGPTVTDAYLLHVPSPAASALAKLGADPAVARVESLQGAPQ